MRLGVAALVLCGAAQGQVEWGFRAGVPLTEAGEVLRSPANFNSKPHRWTFGPTLQVNLLKKLGVTFDALYRKVEYERLTLSRGLLKGGEWEFPVMLRYRGGSGRARPFVAGGASFNKLTGIQTPKSSATGLVFGAGVEVKVPLIRIAPEIRYGHRFGDTLALDGLKSRRDQMTFLVGITF